MYVSLIVNKIDRLTQRLIQEVWGALITCIVYYR